MDIVEVEWFDAATVAHEVMLEEAQKQTGIKAQTVGYLVSDNKERVVLAATLFPEASDARMLNIIPRGMIKKIRKLGKV